MTEQALESTSCSGAGRDRQGLTLRQGCPEGPSPGWRPMTWGPVLSSYCCAGPALLSLLRSVCGRMLGRPRPTAVTAAPFLSKNLDSEMFGSVHQNFSAER